MYRSSLCTSERCDKGKLTFVAHIFIKEFVSNQNSKFGIFGLLPSPKSPEFFISEVRIELCTLFECEILRNVQNCYWKSLSVYLFRTRTSLAINSHDSDPSHLEDHPLMAIWPFHNFPRTQEHPTQNCLSIRLVWRRRRPLPPVAPLARSPARPPLPSPVFMTVH